MSYFGDFGLLCKRAPLPACNLFPNIVSECTPSAIGIPGHRVQDLGTLLLDVAAILLCFLGINLANKKKAAIGRREMQLLLGTIILLSFCDIFTTGRVFGTTENPLYTGAGYGAFSWIVSVLASIELGLTAAFFWMLMLLGIVEFRVIEDGTLLSIGLALSSAVVLLACTTYVSLDTAFGLTSLFSDARDDGKSIALYVLYLLLPLVCAFIFAMSQLVLFIGVVGEKKPLIYLALAASFFSGGQSIEFLASPYICKATYRAIDGAFFHTAMSLVAMGWVYALWNSIAENDVPARWRKRESWVRDEDSVERQYITIVPKVKPVTPAKKPMGMAYADLFTQHYVVVKPRVEPSRSQYQEVRIAKPKALPRRTNIALAPEIGMVEHAKKTVTEVGWAKISNSKPMGTSSI